MIFRALVSDKKNLCIYDFSFTVFCMNMFLYIFLLLPYTFTRYILWYIKYCYKILNKMII